MITDKQKEVNNGFIELNVLYSDYLNKKVDFFKGVTVIQTGSLALLISLKSDTPVDYNSHILFLSSLIVISLCVLFSLGVQYSVVYESNVKLRLKKGELTDRLGKLDELPVSGLEMKVSNKLFLFFYWATLFCLTASMIMLICYCYSLPVEYTYTGS